MLSLPQSETSLSEVDVETSGINDFLKEHGYTLRSRKTGIAELDAAWPTKNKDGAGSGQPDLFLFESDDSASMPLAVWENKGTETGVDQAVAEARGYVEGAHALLRGKPNLPRIAVGYDGRNLRALYLTSDNRWVPIKVGGAQLIDDFPSLEILARGVRDDGSVVEPADQLNARTLRSVLDQLRRLYRGIPALKSGRRPIDFTVALLTLRLIVERKRWGTWSEQPSLVPDVNDMDQKVAERLRQLVARSMTDDELKQSYGSIFKFKEQDENESEIAFDFEAVLKGIPTGKGFYKKIFALIDSLPMLHGADIDIFGEVYQSIGDDAVKKAFGEYFTGRHIIAAVVPVLFARAGIDSFEALQNRRIADVACGTGGFLTETLRWTRRRFDLVDSQASEFAADAFYGYDLSASNASRARVNMYFAGDGFSVIEGGVDSLDPKNKRGPGQRTFDFILTNPPYGSSAEHHLLHEAFLSRVIELLKPSSGWGLTVMPTGFLENPRSSVARLALLRSAQVTDVISLPRHAFAPYTTQSTGIVILRRRPKPLSATTWDELVAQIGDERVSLFMVDHDGFANSDKRFPTRRKSADGSWLHDDLADWTDLSGITQRGKLFAALINENNPSGYPEGTKYQRVSIKEILAQMSQWGADRSSGVELLPDSFLRGGHSSVTPQEYIERVETLGRRVRGELDVTHPSVPEELKHLLLSTIALEQDQTEIRTIAGMFNVAKGDTALTEAAIYEAWEEEGLPVYGGGTSRPSQFISSTAMTSKGKPITVFHGPAIVVSMDGSSGAMQVVSGDFASNHHAAILTPREGESLDLHLVAQQAEARLRGLASNKNGSATLTKGTIETLQVELPADPQIASSIGAARTRLMRIRSLLQ